MTEWIAALSALGLLYLFCALAGGFLFILWLALQFLGGGDDLGDASDAGSADFASDLDLGDADAGAEHGGNASDAIFRVLSVQTLMSFFLMFGLAGLALETEMRVPTPVALGGALAAGVLAVWILDRILRAMAHLQSSGTLPLAAAVGCSGTVYLRIPPEGTGKATVEVAGRLREYNAVSEDGAEIPTNRRIEVVRISSGTLVVKPAD